MYRPAMFSVPTEADSLVVDFAAFIQTSTAVLVEKSSPAALLTEILAFKLRVVNASAVFMPVKGQTQFRRSGHAHEVCRTSFHPSRRVISLAAAMARELVRFPG